VGADYIIMHNRGRGEVRSPNTDYGDVVQDVLDELSAAAERVERAGVPRGSVWLDPGLGFAKTARQSVALLRSLGRFRKTGYRVLVGPSRKSFIAELAPNRGGEPPSADDRLGGTAAAVAICVAAGVDAVRVHDVHVMRQLVRVAEALRASSEGSR
jgi:dihydropteroate synthase